MASKTRKGGAKGGWVVPLDRRGQRRPRPLPGPVWHEWVERGRGVDPPPRRWAGMLSLPAPPHANAYGG